MFNWLPEGESPRREKVVDAFQSRIDKVQELSEPDCAIVADNVVRLWAVVIKTVGSVEKFAESSHEDRKHRVVQLVNFEAERLEEKNFAEAWAAELLSYYLAVVAAKDASDEPVLREALEQLGTKADPEFRL